MKTGLVLEGGALRTIFSTGVFDALLEKNVMADYVVGVSAGIAYGVSYVSKQAVYKRQAFVAGQGQHSGGPPLQNRPALLRGQGLLEAAHGTKHRDRSSHLPAPAGGGALVSKSQRTGRGPGSAKESGRPEQFQPPSFLCCRGKFTHSPESAPKSPRWVR